MSRRRSHTVLDRWIAILQAEARSMSENKLDVLFKTFSVCVLCGLGWEAMQLEMTVTAAIATGGIVLVSAKVAQIARILAAATSPDGRSEFTDERERK